MNKEPNFIPDRLNEQPAVMRGCSWPELYSIVIKSFLIATPLGLLLAIYWDNYSSMLAVIPVIVSILFMVLTSRMSALKNGRPVGYFSIKSNLQKQRRGFGRFYIEHDDHWRISKD